MGHVSAAPGTRMSRPERVKILLSERAVFGRPLLFCATPTGQDADADTPPGKVHVVGPDEDQPAYRDFADWAMSRKVRMVCGLDIRRTPLQGTNIGVFDDRRLCWTCHAAFGDDAWMIFDDNTEERQEAAGIITSIRASKAIAWEAP